jgi:hypothetical protein
MSSMLVFFFSRDVQWVVHICICIVPGQAASKERSLQKAEAPLVLV